MGEFNLGSLTSGLLKHTVAGGVSTIETATPGTDYVAPVPAAVENNLASFDADGNPQDSGYAGADFAASTLDAVLADGEWDGTPENILLGATVTAGQALEPYDDSGTIKYKLAVKTSTVGATHLALAAGDAGDTIAGLLAGRHRLDAVYNFAAGNQLWRDLTTDGAITATQPTAEGDVMQFLGYRRSDHIIFWNPAPLPMTLGVQP